MNEVSFTLARSGIELHGWRSGPESGLPTLCLHGWLDNCASFRPLAERLPEHDLVAVDLPGHGLSDPIPSATCQYLDYVACILELATAQGWDRFQLVGHSLGGALATLVAGMYPDRIQRLALIDAIGPLSCSAEDTRKSAVRYLNAYLGDRPQPVYRSRAQAIKARLQLGDILVSTAYALIERDLCEVPGGYSWRSDARLKYPSARMFTEEQVLAFARNIDAPTLLVRAERTALTEQFYPRRIASVPDLEQVTLAGGHHLHMENPDAVADVIRGFLVRQPRRRTMVLGRVAEPMVIRTRV